MCINEIKCNDIGLIIYNFESEISWNVLRLIEEFFSEIRIKIVINEVNLEINVWNILYKEVI